jgi:hypothetical protein
MSAEIDFTGYREFGEIEMELQANYAAETGCSDCATGTCS